MACNNTCTATCSGMCADNCTTECAENCNSSCGTSCFGSCDANCDYQCINECGRNCATVCLNDCSGNCNNGCSGENYTELYENLENINPRTLFEASNIQSIANWIASEATRRNKPAVEITFNKQKKLTAEDINNVILNLRRSHQWIPFVQSKDKANSSLAQELINRVRIVYREKMFPEAPEIIYLYNNGPVPNPDNPNDLTGLDWGIDQKQLTWKKVSEYPADAAGQTTIDENTGESYLYIRTTSEPSPQRASIYTVDTINFSKYYDEDYYLCVQFKSITFARGYDNIETGFEGLGITTELGGKDVSNGVAEHTTILGNAVTRPSGFNGVKRDNVYGACKVSDLMTNPSNGHLYFIVVRPNVGDQFDTKSPQMQINKIWLQKEKPDWLIE